MFVFETLPPEHQQMIRTAIGRGTIREIERHMRIDVARSDTFVPPPEPAAFCEVSYWV